MPRAGQRFGVRPGLGLFFHNRHVGGSTVSGKESSNLTENVDSGNRL